MRGRAIALLLLSAAVTSPLIAQQPAAPSEEERASVYLRDKQNLQRDFQDRLASLGRGADVSEIAQVVRSRHPPQGRRIRHTQATDTALDEVFYKDIALELSSLGFSVGDVRGARGPELIRAAIAKRTAAAAYSDLALLADTIVIGTVASTDLQNASDDGLGGRMMVTLDEVMKGNLRPGDTLTVVLVSGARDQAGRTMLDAEEFLPAAGTRVALLGSRAAYAAQRAWKGRGPSSKAAAMRLVNLLHISGDRVRSKDVLCQTQV